jgi:hypothetical protein
MTMAPALQMANTQQLAAAGAAQDARSQAEADAARSQFYSPWDLMDRYNSVLGSSKGYSTGSQTSPIYTNPASTALGGGIAGLSLFNGLQGAFPGLLGGSAFNPASSYNAAGVFQPFYNGMGAGGYQYG